MAAYSKRLRVAEQAAAPPPPSSWRASSSTTRPPSGRHRYQGLNSSLADGSFGRDGVFHAKQLQAKCASKYAPQQPGAPGAAPAGAPGKSMSQVQSPTPSRADSFQPEPFPTISAKQYRCAIVPSVKFCFRCPSPVTETPAQSAIIVSGVVKQFGRFAALRGVSAEFSYACKFHAILAIMVGKTTLLRALAGLAYPTQGSYSHVRK